MTWHRSIQLPALAALLTFGCSLGSYDYLSAEFGAAVQGGAAGAAGSAPTAGVAGSGGMSGVGGLPAKVNPCEGQDNGKVCDDDDVCTLSSLCSAGVCQGTGEHPCVVADAIAEFSMTQGLQGFSYGAWPQGTDVDGSYQEGDFTELTACPAETWKPACLEMGDPAFRWTLITAQLQHASTIPMLEIPVRRWVSDVSGDAVASVDHHHANPGAGDGTKAQVLVDGVSVWESEIGPTDAVGRQADIPIRLQTGTRVELLLYPRANQASDMTHFSMVLRDK